MSTTNDFIISTVEEDIFLFINYKDLSAYIKISFRINDKFPIILLRRKISEALIGLNTRNCNFYWHNVPVAEEDLVPLIKAKAGCGHFQLNIKDKEGFSESPELSPDDKLAAKVVLEETDSASESPHDMVSSEVLSSSKFRAFVNENVLTRKLLISDHTEPSIRRSIISCACDFLFREIGEYPTVSERNNLVKVVVDVFRGLEQQEEFVTKWLHMRIKNSRRKQIRNPEEDGPLEAKQKKYDFELSPTKTHALESTTEKLRFLKNCQSLDDVPRIKTALKDTLSYRVSQCFKEDFSVFNTYKFFGKSLELINYEFDLRFPSASDDFIANLELFMDAACNIYRAENKNTDPIEVFEPSIQKLLCICNYTKTPNGPLKPGFTIKQMLDSFVSFLTEDNDEKPAFLEHPILIAQGPSQSRIQKYYLQIETVLLELPSGTVFSEAFEYLLKAYYVFNIAFPKVLTIFFNFIMMNVFDITVKSKADAKKNKIEDNLSRPRDFLRKILKCINDVK